jgi:hypothetical protein
MPKELNFFDTFPAAFNFYVIAHGILLEEMPIRDRKIFKIFLSLYRSEG